MTTVVVQYAHDPPLTDEALAAMVATLTPCLEVYEVATRQRYVSLDRRTSIAIYEAPDASRVTTAHGINRIGYAKLWPVTAV